jgi:outer membrane protein
MKKIVSGLIALAIYGVSLSAFAGNTPATAPQNNLTVTNPSASASATVGVLDMRQVMEKSVQFAQIREKIQKDFQPKQQKVVAAQKNFKDDSDRLNRDNAIMNNNDRKQLEQKILTEQQDVQHMQATFQQELMAEQNKELKGFLDSVKNVVEKIAKTDDLNLVITKDVVAYVKPKLDITNRVIQQLPHK